MSIYPLQKGWKVLDIGSNRGEWTREAVRLGCTVVACEPIAKYRQSILDAGASIVLPVAVSDIEDSVTFHIGQDDRFSSIHGEWVREADSAFGWNHQFELVQADTIRLDKLLWLFGGFDFIKADCEGHEPSVIRSLGEHRPKRMSLEYHGGNCDLKALDGATKEALELLGSDYIYRFAAESAYWISDWLEIGQAVSLLDYLAWGDVYCLRKDIFADEQP
jgi:FkbM family methyltransferase